MDTVVNKPVCFRFCNLVWQFYNQPNYLYVLPNNFEVRLSSALSAFITTWRVMMAGTICSIRTFGLFDIVSGVDFVRLPASGLGNNIQVLPVAVH